MIDELTFLFYILILFLLIKRSADHQTTQNNIKSHRKICAKSRKHNQCSGKYDFEILLTLLSSDS